MNVCFKPLYFSSGDITYSFHNVDLLFDFLLSIDMKPFIEIGFMPTALASGPETCFFYKGNVTAPSEYDEWSAFVKAFVIHLAERYGLDEIRTWFFEVWNEPNLKFFWKGDKQEYMKLYRSTALAVKSVDSQLPVGGPATSVNAWITDIINFCKETDTPLDFISTHHYPSDDPLWAEGGMNFDIPDLSTMNDEEKAQALEKAKEFYSNLQNRPYPRGVLTEMATKAKEQASGLPLYYTEWNAAVKHDEPYAACLVAKTLVDNQGIVDGYSYWTFSDLFEEGGQSSKPFHNGFGLMNIHGIAKPTFRVYELFHKLGDQRLPVISGTEHPTIEMVAVKKGDSLTCIVYNQNTPSGEVTADNVTLTFENLKSKQAKLIRIDENNANAKKTWENMGSPMYPSANQLEILNEASKPCYETVDLSSGSVSFTLEPHAIAAVII
jgi:xylan 1,4-beta-xylosidase